MAAPYRLRPLEPHDLLAIQALHDRVFGPGRFARTAYRVREGLAPFSPLCRLAETSQQLVAALRMAPILVGARPGAQLLGPLAVEPLLKGQGFGRALVTEALICAKEAGQELVLLVGDLPYYGRYGFNVAEPGQFDLGGPVNPARVLMLELQPSAARSYRGLVTADFGRSK